MFESGKSVQAITELTKDSVLETFDEASTDGLIIENGKPCKPCKCMF